MNTRKKRRLTMVLACGIGLGSATALCLAAFSSTLSYFLGPAQVAAHAPAPGLSFRLGGIVQVGTVATTTASSPEGGTTPTTTFRVTDGKASIPVTFSGVLPDLFREGQGVVAIGSMTPSGTFTADEVLAKHGSSYMPPEVEQALKQAGKWDPKYGPPPAATTWNTMPIKSQSS